jgi:PST family polysaccharide transporter
MPRHKTGKDYRIKLSINLGLMVITLIIYRVVLEGLNWYQFSRLGDFVLALVGVFLGALVYISGMIKNNLFTEEEWRMLPFGEKIVKRMKNKK